MVRSASLVFLFIVSYAVAQDAIPNNLPKTSEEFFEWMCSTDKVKSDFMIASAECTEKLYPKQSAAEAACFVSVYDKSMDLDNKEAMKFMCDAGFEKMGEFETCTVDILQILKQASIESEEYWKDVYPCAKANMKAMNPK